MATGKELPSLKGSGGSLLVFSADGRRLATSGEQKRGWKPPGQVEDDTHKVTVWDLTTGQELRTFNFHTEWMGGFQPLLSPDGQVEELPLFGKDWGLPAQLPGLGAGIASVSGGSVHSSDIAERDMSVQLSGWLLMESAYLVSAAGYPKRR